MNRKLIWIGAGLVLLLMLGVGGGYGFSRWRVHVQRQRDLRNLSEARRALSTGAIEDARRHHADSRQLGFPNPHLVRDWQRIELELAVSSRDPLRLLSLFQSDRAVVESDERASLALVASLRQLGRREEERALREKWRGKEMAKDSWMFLDVEALIEASREVDAQRLLESNRFTGDAEGMRLVRLARLKNLGGQVEPLLDQALLAAPTNALVLSARGKFYESQGDVRLAAFEYASALALDPGDAALREQAGDFLFRAGARETAIGVWSSGPAGTLGEAAWLKAWFWRRALRPVGELAAAPAVAGELAPVVGMLRGLPPGRLWDPEAAGRIVNIRDLFVRRPEFSALEILDVSARRDWAALAEAVERPGRRESLSPEMENAFYELAVWRSTGKVAPAPGRFHSEVSARRGRHPLLVELDGGFQKARLNRTNQPVLSAGTMALVTSDRLIPAVLLAVEWPEAALQLTPKASPTAGLPELYLVEHAMALRSNRGAAEADAFLSGLARTPVIDCARGEVLMALQKRDDARALLKPHAALTNRHGMRAAYLMGVDALERKAWTEATAYIDGNRAFAASITGRELRAQVVLASGDVAGAEKLFAPMATESPVAARFLAERAKARGDWVAARDLVAKLSRSFPDNPGIRSELLELRRKTGAPAGRQP